MFGGFGLTVLLCVAWSVHLDFACFILVMLVWCGCSGLAEGSKPSSGFLPPVACGVPERLRTNERHAFRSNSANKLCTIMHHLWHNPLMGLVDGANGWFSYWTGKRAPLDSVSLTAPFLELSGNP